MKFDVNHPEIVDAVRRALAEDIGAGDITSTACVSEIRLAGGRFVAKERLVVAGVDLLPLIWEKIEPGRFRATAELAPGKLARGAVRVRQPAYLDLNGSVHQPLHKTQNTPVISVQ